MRPPTARRAAPPARRAFFLVASLVALLVASVLAGPASPASAHAFLERSTPSDGAVLSAAPRTLELQFSESVVLGATHIDVVDGDGRHYQPESMALIPQQNAGGAGRTAVVAGLPTLPKNAFRVSWETLSSDDLHRSSGVIVFGIARPVTAAGLSEPLPNPGESSLRWLVFLSLSIALGGSLAARLFRRQNLVVAAWTAARCQRWSAVGALCGAVLAAGLLLDQLANGGGTRGLTNAYVQHWLLREAGFTLLFLAARTGRRAGGAAWYRSLVFSAGAGAACLGTALLGHAAAGDRLAVTRVAADAAHVAATGFWAGTLLVLGLVAHLLRQAQAPAAIGRAALRAFGVPATICMGTMVVTGLYLVSGVVGSVDAALLTFYGRTLLLKVTLVAFAGGLGLLNAVRLRQSGRPAPRRTVAAEGVLAVVILALAAVLTSAAPAREPQLIRSATATVPVLDGQVGDLQETLAIRPNRPGRNVALLGVLNTRRPAPAPVNAVDITFVRPDGGHSTPAPAEKLADGQWSVPVTLTAAGPTHVRVTAHRAGFPATTRTYDWVVGAASADTRPVTLSNAPIAGVLRQAAAGLAVLLVGAAAAAVWRRRRRRRPLAHRVGSEPAVLEPREEVMSS